MRLSPESPELTAYALGELDPADRAKVEAALKTSAELRAELADIQQTIGLLHNELASQPAVTLSPEQRAALLEHATQSLSTEAKSTSGANPFTDSSETAGTSTHPNPWGWIEPLLAWRRELLWATVGACAVAVVIGSWTRRPQTRLALVHPPEPPKAVSQTPRLQTSGKAEAVPASAPVEGPTPPPAIAGGPSKPVIRPEPSPVPATQPTSTPKVDATPSATGTLETAVAPPPTQPQPQSPPPTPVAPVNRPSATSIPTTKSEGVVTQKATAASGERAASPREPAREQNRAMSGSLSSDTFKSSKGDAREKRDSESRTASKTSAGIASAETTLSLSKSREQVMVATATSTQARSVLQETRIHPPESSTSRGEGYEPIEENTFRYGLERPLSTFGLDVDTASYANVRRHLRAGSLPPRDAVRLEELINYFHYDYPQPRGEHPFLAAIEIADSPWRQGYKLVRIGLQARSRERIERRPANLVFLVDVSGSMSPENKLPLVKSSLRLLLEQLQEGDRVGLVTYAAGSQVLAEPTAVDAEGKAQLLAAIDGLNAGGGTHGSAGIQAAYDLARRHFKPGQVNRVILCTDGDFNVGVTSAGGLEGLIVNQARSGVFLTVLGYGNGNFQDATAERLADKGNGNYAYIDSFSEARKVLSEQLDGTLVTVAKDAKVQVEFNPDRVRSYRLIGYENRALQDRDFNDDTKDAGDIGTGHQVTVLYEIEPETGRPAGVDPLRYQGSPKPQEKPARSRSDHEDELLFLKIRYKSPDGTTSRLIETPVKDTTRGFDQASADFRFAAAVAGYGMLLRQSPNAEGLTWEAVARMAERSQGTDKGGYRAEFIDLIRQSRRLEGQRPDRRPLPRE